MQKNTLTREGVEESLFSAFIKEANLVQASKSIFNFLSQYIPFDYTSLLMADASFIDLTPVIITDYETVIPIYSSRKRHEMLNMQAFFENSIIIGDVTINNKINMMPSQSNTLQHLGDVKSVMAILVIDTPFHKYIFNLFSKKENNFTREHAEIFHRFQGILRQFVSSFIELSPDFSMAKAENLHQPVLDMMKASKGLKSVMQQVEGVAQTQSLIFIYGESGVGKELVAESIHLFSKRKHEKLLKVNCAAITESLMNSELFGHEKGAFTGANSLHQGYFERAEGGTLVLDEIGELSLASQASLLRILEQKEFFRVGGRYSIKLDTRIIVSTNKDIPKMVREGKFREDLWYRLNVFPIYIPPLRQRREDLSGLIHYACALKAKELELSKIPALSEVEMNKLLHYDWPGNVRQLLHVIERAMIMASIQSSSMLKVELPIEMTDEKMTKQVEPYTSDFSKIKADFSAPLVKNFPTLDEHAAELIRSAQIKCEGRIEGEHGMARLLGVKANTLRGRMKRMGISFGREIF